MSRAPTQCLALAVFGSFCLGPSEGASQITEGRVAHWTLVSAAMTFGDSIGSPTARYRLSTLGGNLAVNTQVFEGVDVRSIGSFNVVFHRQSKGGSVNLNEPVAIYFHARRAYLVHKSGPAHDLGLADWEPSREPPQPRPAEIFQWQFQSLPHATTRDHRQRPLKTREPLALFNSATNQFLVYDRNTRKLRWQEP